VNIGLIFKQKKGDSLSVGSVGLSIQLALCLAIVAGHVVYANTPTCQNSSAEDGANGWSWEDGGTCRVQLATVKTYDKIEIVADRSISNIATIKAFEGTDVEPFNNTAVKPFELIAIEPFENTAIEIFKESEIEPFQTTTIVAFKNTIKPFEETVIEPFRNTSVLPFENSAIQPFEETILSQR